MNCALLGLVVVGFVPLACKATAPSPTRSRVDPIAKDTVHAVDRLRDTTRASVTLADARAFRLRTPAERDSFRAVLRKERALWRATSPQNYQFLLRVDCFCPGVRGWLLIDVRSGQPLRAWGKDGKPAALSDWNTFSIDGLFDMLEQASNMDGVVQVAFDPRWHFPAEVRTVALPGPDRWTIIEARGLTPTRL